MAAKKSGSGRSLMDDEESRVWAGLYRRVRDPAVASEIIAVLDDDADCKGQHPGLYLQARIAQRSAKRRQARIAALRRATGTVFRGLGVPLRVLVSACVFLGDVVLAPKAVDEEPATRTVRRLSKRVSPSGQKDQKVDQASAVQDKADTADAGQQTAQPNGPAQASVK